MPSSIFQEGCIKGISVTIPTIKKSINDMAELIGGDLSYIEKIKQNLGLNELYVADEKTTGADLCENAAINLLNDTKISKDSIDAIVYVTQTPDYIIPATATYLHKRLELSKNCAAFDVSLGCSGYVYGLWLSYMMVESGGCSNVLLMAGDTLSKCLNPKDRATSILFGDAGSATLIQRKTHNTKANESFFSMNTDGKGYDSLIIPAGGFRLPASTETAKEYEDEEGNIRSLNNLYMNGMKVMNFTIKEIPKAVKGILEFSKKTEQDIDYVFFHQANKYIIQNLTKRIGFPFEKTPCNVVSKFGNQTSVSIPASICDEFLSLESNDINKKAVLSGFGAGLSWATCLVDLNNISCSINYLDKEV